MNQPRSVRSLAAVVAVTWALVGVSMNVPGVIPVASAQPCPDVEVVFARGTNEPPGIGGVGQPFVDALRQRLGGRSVGTYAVNYPASEAFTSSAPDGGNDAARHVDAMARDCPRTKMVLGGYSQGASVIDLVTLWTGPPVSDKVAAVAVFGNPSSNLSRVLLGGQLPAIAPLYAPKTIDLCVPDDPICSEGQNWPAHVAYQPAGLVDQAADFVAGRL